MRTAGFDKEMAVQKHQKHNHLSLLQRKKNHENQGWFGHRGSIIHGPCQHELSTSMSLHAQAIQNNIKANQTYTITTLLTNSSQHPTSTSRQCINKYIRSHFRNRVVKNFDPNHIQDTRPPVIDHYTTVYQ